MMAHDALPHKQDDISKSNMTEYVHPHALNSSRATKSIPPPVCSGDFSVDEAVMAAFPVPGTVLIKAYHYGSSLSGQTAKLIAELPDGIRTSYFLKTVPNEYPGRQMIEGEFESLKAVHAVVPTFVPVVYAWGPLQRPPGYFLLTEFKEIGQQPPDADKLSKRLAELHRESESPTGKFGFHVPTCHGNISQAVGWEESWATMFSKILARSMDLDTQKHGPWPEFTALRQLLFDHVIPRLLDPLQSDGRALKPSLIHGDIWDENCATDPTTGEPFAFDAGSIYAHNELEIGYWRPIRHRLSHKSYVEGYKKHFPPSPPEHDWDARHILYSIRWNISLSVIVPTSGQRPVVFEDMRTLCRMFAPRHFKEIESQFRALDPRTYDARNRPKAEYYLPPPPFSLLPLDPTGPGGNAWGRFGAKDDLGMLNLLSPAVVARAAQEIRSGVRISLDWTLDKPRYPSYHRHSLRHELVNRAKGEGLRVVNDDILTLNTQTSSQWDGFRHFGYLKEKRYFNNHTHEEITSSSALGIDAWAQSGGITGRGVLIDYASWASQNSIPISPFTSSEIPLSDLKQIIELNNITFEPGDILFIRSGFTQAFNALTPSEQEALAARPTASFAGVESTEAMLRFLWDHQFAAVAGDQPAFERSPVTGPDVNDRFVLHEWLLAGWGMPIGEMFNLEGLSEMCKSEGRWSFFLCSVPLKVPGGVASPPNAVAIF